MYWLVDAFLRKVYSRKRAPTTPLTGEQVCLRRLAAVAIQLWRRSFQVECGVCYERFAKSKASFRFTCRDAHTAFLCPSCSKRCEICPFCRAPPLADTVTVLFRVSPLLQLRRSAYEQNLTPLPLSSSAGSRSISII